MREVDKGRDGAVPDWRSAFRDASRPSCDPHADFEFFDPFGGRAAPPGRMRNLIRQLDGHGGTIESALALIAEAVDLKASEVLDVYYPGWFPDATFGVIAVAGRSARPWGIIKFRAARPTADTPSPIMGRPEVGPMNWAPLRGRHLLPEGLGDCGAGPT